jgi:hypothetical protein
MHRARYCLGRTHEVICPACLGMDAGPKPRSECPRHDSGKPAGESGVWGVMVGRSAPAQGWRALPARRAKLNRLQYRYFRIRHAQSRSPCPAMFEARDVPGGVDRTGMVCLAINVLRGADLSPRHFGKNEPQL